MSKTESLYLDVWRFVCAVIVVFGHISGKRFTDGVLWQASFLMSQAVTVFFVLSGYVIAYVLDTRENTWKDYAVSRLARLYSVVIPALILTAVLDFGGRIIAPAAYSPVWGFHGDGPSHYLESLFFINEVWFFHNAPCSDLPFWSLGYEAWYYAIAGVAWFWGRRKWLAIALLLGLAGPDIVAMFPLWLMGFFAYRIRRWSAVKALLDILGPIFWLVPLGALVVYECLAWRYGRLFSSTMLFFNRGELFEDYLVGFLCAVHFCGFAGLQGYLPMRLPERLGRGIRWVAGATFSTYLYHLPIAQFVSVVLPENKASHWVEALTVLLTFCGIFLMAEFSERKKEWWRKAVYRAIDPTVSAGHFLVRGSRQAASILHNFGIQ